MKETIFNLPITRNTDLECEIESRLLTGLENRKERGLFLSPIVLQAENTRGYLGFSAISTPACALWYCLKGIEPLEEDPGSRLGFDTGHLMEAYVLDLLEATSRQKEVELKWPDAPGERILGHIDGLIKAPELPGAVVIECKATGGYSFSKKEEEGPDPGHVAQAFCYSVLLKTYGFSIIYINREAKKASSLFEVFAFQLEEKEAWQGLFTLVAERFSPVLEGLKQDRRPLPPMEPKWEFGPRGWRCRPDRKFKARGRIKRQVGYCSYRHICPEAQRYADEKA